VIVFVASLRDLRIFMVIDYGRCPRSLRSRVYVTVGRPSLRLSVYLSHQSTVATACCRFAAERRASKRYQPTAAGTVQQAPALSSSGVAARRPSRP